MSKIAAIQMASGPKVDANLIEVSRLVEEAVQQGAGMIVLPENFAIMGNGDQDVVAQKEPYGDGPIQRHIADLARKHQVWIVAGTIPVESPDASKVYACCLVFNDQGEVVARYDKIHLFDVNLIDSDETYNESHTIQHGEEITVVDTPFGKLGMAICYDLRFPELFRYMARQGAQIFTLPSAFTESTGKAHWESLIRSRAIENLAYVVAPGQGGYHASGRQTHGNSMIVDPWGTIVDRLPKGSGVVISEIDLEQVNKVRNSFPALEHRKVFCDLP
ncbi:MAG: carbon-nitrogen hydrolase family protein [Gammaproteobacteria bacterium]|nr:carbon-nitrogen hydrolase family protein [Gammaproteobacteria bacterium]